MNDMSGNFADAAPVHHFDLNGSTPRAARLAPPRAFSEAAALVEDAMAQLRAVESALERQLRDLSGHINGAMRNLNS